MQKSMWISIYFAKQGQRDRRPWIDETVCLIPIELTEIILSYKYHCIANTNLQSKFCKLKFKTLQLSRYKH